MEGILLNFLMGVLGLITYVVFTSLDKIIDKNYGLQTHFQENYKRWLWGLSMLALIVATLHLEPSIGELINGAIGLDVVHVSGSFWLVGVNLAVIIKEKVKKVFA